MDYVPLDVEGIEEDLRSPEALGPGVDTWSVARCVAETASAQAWVDWVCRAWRCTPEERRN